MITEDGAKPQLTIVGKEGEVAATLTEPESYDDHLQNMMRSLREAKTKGEQISPFDYLSRLSPGKDNSAICDYMVSIGLLTKHQFNKAMDTIKRQDEMRDKLGFVPTTVMDLVEKYTEAERITLTAKGTLGRKRRIIIGDQVIDESILASKDPADAAAQYQYRLENAAQETLETLRRELRLLSADYSLGFSEQNIADAVRTWETKVRSENKVRIFHEVKYLKGRATGPVGIKMWEDMEAACFDVTDTAPGFAIAVIKKFMWQVKRKALGLDISRHLMPVITGPQEKGKSTFVEQMTMPLVDTMMRVSFDLLTDEKTINIWSNHILFLDEMGGFTKADVDKVKNIITSPEVTIRIMRANDAEPIRQQSTLIGCSNKSLEQLVRDDTGVRRFAELSWLKEPNWDAMNAVDWSLLWQSVDEFADDPITLAGMQAHLVAQQKANRVQGSVETFARSQGHLFKDWTQASTLYSDFREYEEENFPGSFKTDANRFGREMSGLMKNLPDFEWEKKRTPSGNSYRHTGL